MAAQKFADEARQQVLRDEEAQRRRADDRIQLSVVSDPVGAVVEASWKGGVKAAVTPFDLEVPKNSNVKFSFSKKEYISSTVQILADTPQVVRASLTAEPKPVAPVKSRPAKAEKAKASDKESDIPLEF